MTIKIDVSDSEFEEKVIEESKKRPVMVDFWASWCGPCMALGPSLENIANEKNGAVLLAKVDVDTNQETARKFGIRGIPAVKLFVDGKIVDEFVGAVPEGVAKSWLERHL